MINFNQFDHTINRNEVEEVEIRGIGERTSITDLVTIDNIYILPRIKKLTILASSDEDSIQEIFVLEHCCRQLVDLECNNLIAFPKLENLVNLRLHSEVIRTIPMLPNLESLYIHSNSFERLPSMPKLQFLVLNCPSVSSLPSLPSVSSLNIANCTGITALPVFRNMTHLNIINTSIVYLNYNQPRLHSLMLNNDIFEHFTDNPFENAEIYNDIQKRILTLSTRNNMFNRDVMNNVARIRINSPQNILQEYGDAYVLPNQNEFIGSDDEYDELD
jgi:hypothetical protein